jgi:hypothetical protein
MMPCLSRGPYLWLRPAECDGGGRIRHAACWIIKERGRQYLTGCGAGCREEAEKRLADYIAEKYPVDTIAGEDLNASNDE